MADSKQIDLTGLTLADLKALLNRVDEEIHERREGGKRWLRSHGLVEKREMMYRNPNNAAETWSGKGKPPDWIQRALAEGYSLESLEANSDRDFPTHRRRRRHTG